MKLSSLFITLLLFSLLSGMAYADIQINTYSTSKDFSLTSAYSEVSVCSCSTKYDTITVTNTGTWPAVFTISINEIKSKLTLSQNVFELQSGQSQEVLLYITADCSRGTDKLEITVTSNLGPQKTLEKNIVRDRCQNIKAWVSNYTKDINPCESKTFDINVQNVGPFADGYIISSNYDDVMTYTARAFNLEPNQAYKVSATAKFGCEVYGQKDIVFSINSVKNKLTATSDAPLNILRSYDYDLKINSDDAEIVNFGVCNRVYSTLVPITIYNKGSVANEYTVTLEDLPKFAKVKLLDSNTFNLNPKETKTFYIDVDASNYRSERKTKEFTIKVSSKYGDVNKESKVLLNLAPCYEHQVIILDSDNSQRKALEVCSGYEYTYNVDIINNGVFKETFKLSLEGVPSSIKLSKDTVTIEPGKKATVQLLVKGPEYNAYYNVIVRATLPNWLSESDNIWIKSYDRQSCHATSIDKTKFRINYQTSILNIPISNNGIVDNQYVVTWEGSNIIDGDEIQLNVNASNTKKVVLPVISGNLNEGTYVGEIVVKDASGAKYSQDVSIKLKDKSIVRKAFEYLAFGNVCKQVSLAQVLLILLIIILIIIFLVRGPHYPYSFWNRLKSKTSVIVLLAVIFLVGIILVVTITGFPKTHAQVYNLTANSSELEYEWLQDDKYILDVSGFFYDPENSTLKYEVSGLKHIQTSSSGNKITFYPEKGWSGTEYAKITAYDKMNGKVTSPEFTLTVMNVPQKSKLELYNIYCWYINLIIFAIVLLFVFVAVFVKQAKRTRK